MYNQFYLAIGKNKPNFVIERRQDSLQNNLNNNNINNNLFK